MEILDWLKNQKTTECQIAHDEIALLRANLSKPQPTSQEVLDALLKAIVTIKSRRQPIVYADENIVTMSIYNEGLDAACQSIKVLIDAAMKEDKP